MHVCSIAPISLTVGANRIVPSVAIPHPLGDPEKRPEEEHALRRELVLKALSALESEVAGQEIFG